MSSDGLPPIETQDPAVTWEMTVVRQAVHDLVQRLPERLQAVIVARYGLDGRDPAIYRHIGATLGLSGERARQLHTEALVWLRHPAHSQILRSLLGRHTIADYQLADDLAQRWLQRRGGRRDR
jgi:DNA-directed RNA polymerase sigma subunit (sigma70/sigma32)